MNAYWKIVVRRALKETLERARVNGVWTALYTVGVPIIGGAITWWQTGSFAWSAAGAFVGLIVISVVFFLARLVALPATIAREVENTHLVQLTEIKKQRDELQALLGAIMPGQEAAERERRANVVRQLVERYVLGHDGISTDMRTGLELPPEKWLNAELEHRGHSWRVRDLGQGRFETY